MEKTYIVDTNVLVHDPRALFKFEDNELIVPIHVLEEIDHFKRDSTERGRTAREVARLLDELRENHGSLAQGIPINNGGRLRVYVPSRRPQLSIALDPNSGDHAIIQAAIELRDAQPERQTIFVTMDVNLRVRADALGLKTQVYVNQAVEPDALEMGIRELDVSVERMEAFFHHGQLEVEENSPERELLYPNVSVLLRQDSNTQKTALARVDTTGRIIRKLHSPREGVMGIRPRNKEQSFALDLLLDNNVRLVTLVGTAGTGKTLLALAAGLSLSVVDGTYSRLLVSRPVIPLGKDLGYLPGDVQEKMGPWMKPIFDNLEYLLIGSGTRRRGVGDIDALVSGGQIEIEPLAYIRGRSLPHQYVIVDEAQNLTPHEVKTVITRCAEGTKIVLTGDPYQIDNPYVDSSTNGLSYVADRLRGEPLAGHIVLRKGERSELANLAAHRL
ncbi:MAG TPA: PhoH family protein [Polyangiaceae bacterium]|nr:PhoH family protein [Polyangiaceae bacterium]